MRVLLLTLPLTAAQMIAWEGSWGAIASRSQLVRALGQPDAFGQFPLRGFNVTNSYADGAVIDGWTLSFNITADVASDQETGSSDPPQFLSAAGIKLNPPKELLRVESNGSTVIGHGGADDSWRGCLTVMIEYALPEETIERGFADDGTCGTMLGEECVKAIELEARDNFVSNTIQNRTNQCEIPTWPEACWESLGIESGRQGVGAVGTGFDFTHPNFTIDHLAIIASEADETRGNKTRYDRLGQAHPVVITWGYSKSHYEESTGANWPSQPLVAVRCLKASQGATNETVLPNSSGATTYRSLAGWWLSVAALAGGFAILI